MKTDRKTRTKLTVLIVILVAVWVVIGIRYVSLSRYWTARTATQAAQQHVHPGGEADRPTAAGQPAEAAPSLRLASRVTPVAPPKSDPFQPAIDPRTRRGTSTAAAPPPEPRPLVPLPPPPSPSRTTADRNTLRLTGVLMGDPRWAVLRIGDESFHVREGSRLNGNIVVQTIEQSAVTLRDGRGTYRLRLGQ